MALTKKARNKTRRRSAVNNAQTKTTDVNEKPRIPSEHLSILQKQCLCSLFHSHPVINGPVSAYPEVKQLWEKCAELLNSLPGPTKEVDQWRRALKDLLYRRKKKSQKLCSWLDHQRELNQRLAPEFGPPNWTEEEIPDPTSVLLHDIDPSLSDTVSYSDTETKPETFSDDIEEPNTELSQTAELDEFCFEAQNVIPPLFFEEIVGCLMSQETTPICSSIYQNDFEELSLSRFFSFEREIYEMDSETAQANAQNACFT